MAKKMEKFKHCKKSEACSGPTSCLQSAPKNSTSKPSTPKNFNSQSSNNSTITTCPLTNPWTWCSSHLLLNICWLSVVSSSSQPVTRCWSVSEVLADSHWQDWPLKCVNMKFSKSKSPKRMAKSNGKKISRKSWNSQAVKTSPQFSCSQTVKSRMRLLSKTLTICWTLMKYPTCSHRIKKLNWLKWYAQLWKTKVGWKKALQHNCTVSSWRNARKICTSYWPSVQSATISVPESACSHL